MITVTLGCSASVNTPLGIALLNGVALCGIRLAPPRRYRSYRLAISAVPFAIQTTCLSALAVFGILFPTYNASLLWLGVYLRDPALRAFVPLCKSEMIHVPKYKNALQFRSAGHR
jgi:hypothetical protein